MKTNEARTMTDELKGQNMKGHTMNQETVKTVLTVISELSDMGITKPIMKQIVDRLPWQSRYDRADWTKIVTKVADAGQITRNWDAQGNPFYTFPLYRGSNLLPTLQD